jgi:tetratricopeptide (TPR) repeat protein
LKARLLLAQHDLEGAIAVLEKALASEVRSPAGRREMEEARDRHRAMADRIAALNAVLAQTPDDPRPLLDLAAIAAEAGSWDRAADLASRASAISGGDDVRLLLGYYLLRGQNAAAALPILQDLASRGSAPALLNLGIAQAALGRDEDAAASYRGYLERHPGDPIPHLYLGNSLLRLGRTSEAEASYRAYLDLAAGDEKTGKVRRLVRLLGEAGGNR